MDSTHTPAAKALPDGFTFSQSSLQTYTDCPRRFWLTYIRQLPWPAVEVAPIQEHELLLRLGEAFHRLVQRAEIGIAPDLLAVGLADPLDLWFRGYLHHRPTDLPKDVVEIEYSVSIPIAPAPMAASSSSADDAPPSYRLTALMDLLAVEPGTRAVIVDWKTNRRRPDHNTARRRLQSQVYPYVLVEASQHMPWGPLDPEQVEMRYWYTAAPDQPIVLPYDSAQHAATARDLPRIIAEIAAKAGEAEFEKVHDTEENRRRFCHFCAYRSRCDRGSTAGALQEILAVDDRLEDSLSGLAIDLDAIEEVAF